MRAVIGVLLLVGVLAGTWFVLSRVPPESPVPPERPSTVVVASGVMLWADSVRVRHALEQSLGKPAVHQRSVAGGVAHYDVDAPIETVQAALAAALASSTADRLVIDGVSADTGQVRVHLER